MAKQQRQVVCLTCKIVGPKEPGAKVLAKIHNRMQHPTAKNPAKAI